MSVAVGLPSVRTRDNDEVDHVGEGDRLVAGRGQSTDQPVEAGVELGLDLGGQRWIADGASDTGRKLEIGSSSSNAIACAGSTSSLSLVLTADPRRARHGVVRGREDAE
jgi:hypothetical protein